jgi:hypothetical protein
MSFGVVQTMITTLKNNEKMRSKRDKFKRSVGGFSRTGKPEYDFPKATPKMLNDIKDKLRKEHKRRMIKVVVLTIVIFSGLVSAIIF